MVWRAIALLMMVVSYAAAQEVLPLATGEWPPYNSSQMAGGGVHTEIVVAVVNEMGMVPQYTFHPWKRVEKLLEQGMVFGAFSYTSNPQRAARFDFTKPFAVSTTQFFYFKPNTPAINWKNWEDLKPYRLAGVLGYSYLPNMRASGATVIEVTSDAQLIPLLRAGRADFVALDSVNGWLEINKHFAAEVGQFGTLEKTLHSDSPSFVMVSRQYPDYQRLIDRFNDALDRIRRNGGYDAILMKHGLDPTAIATSTLGD